MTSERKHLFIEDPYISTLQTKELKQFYSALFFTITHFFLRAKKNLISFEIQMKLPRTYYVLHFESEGVQKKHTTLHW